MTPKAQEQQDWKGGDIHNPYKEGTQEHEEYNDEIFRIEMEEMMYV